MINGNKKVTNNIKFNRRKEMNKMKKRIFTICIMVAALAIVAFGAVGCKKATGGGWIPVHYDWSELSEDGTPAHYVDMLGIATFGFQTRCETIDDQAVYTGNVQYNDHYNNIKLHGTVYYETGISSCEELCEQYDCYGINNLNVYGTYKPQPKGDPGMFYISIEDNGKPGETGSEDVFSISLSGGKYDGYYNGGNLGGGNIQVHQDKDK